jgi:transposase
VLGWNRGSQDKKILAQQAEIGQLREALRRCESERAVFHVERDEAQREREAFRAERDQLFCQVADLKRQLTAMVHAVAHADERVRAALRREFGASSERLLGDTQLIPEIAAYMHEQGMAITPDAAATAKPEGQGADDTQPQADDQDTAAVPSQNAAPQAQPGENSGNSTNKKKRKRPASAGGRKPLPPELERRHRTYQPPADHPALRHAAGFDIIGQTQIERLNIGKLDIHVEVITCPVARLKLPQGITCQETLSPPAVIARGQVSDAVLVHSAVDKIADHLPAYRQEMRLARIGIELDRNKLCRWHIALGDFLRPVADEIFTEILRYPVIGIDDTVHRLLVPELTRCQNARIWGITAPTGVYHLFSPTREGTWISTLLADYRGAVMGDAYAGHTELLTRDGIIAIFCWAHVRRKFFESADQQRRRLMLDLIAELYRIEHDLRDATPEARVFARTARAKPVLARIKAQLDAWATDPQVLPSSGIGRAVAYARKLWPGLEQYTTLGNAPIDNNATERCLRAVAMHRKNSLFSASEPGAEAYATLLTLVETAKLHELDPVGYLNDVLADLHHDRRPLAELTPQTYAARTGRGSKQRP